MRHSRPLFLFVLFLTAVLSAPSFAQQPPVFNWLPANDESVRLDPANYHTGRTYRPNAPGQNNHVDIKAQKPVTIFMTPAAAWSQALERPDMLLRLPQSCLREHVLETTYVCEMPVEPMTLIIRDDRNSPDNAIFAGLGAVLDPNDRVQRAVGQGVAAILAASSSVTARRFKDPNDVHIQYYRWDCVENCIQPEFQWTTEVKEKYQLTSFVKVYGGFVPDHDGAQVCIKIKAPMPMLVAVMPSQAADQLHVQPETLETALERNSCQQRGVQTMEFQCTFNLNDGPQSLVVAPEAGMKIPHKKAEIEMQFVKCVANCSLLLTQQR